MNSLQSLAGKLDAISDDELDGEVIAAALELATPEAAYKMIVGCTDAGPNLAAQLVGRKFQGWAGDVVMAA